MGLGGVYETRGDSALRSASNAIPSFFIAAYRFYIVRKR